MAPIKRKIIVLTDRAPVSIREGDWPVIASALGDSFVGSDPARHNQAQSQGQLTEWEMAVRQHADGRAIVYGRRTTPSYLYHEHDWAGGTFVTDGLNLAAIIRSVGEAGDFPSFVIDSCIASLPPEELQ